MGKFTMPFANGNALMEYLMFACKFNDNQTGL